MLILIQKRLCVLTWWFSYSRLSVGGNVPVIFFFNFFFFGFWHEMSPRHVLHEIHHSNLLNQKNCPCFAGLIPLPLSVVLWVETNQSESPLAHSWHQGCTLYPAFPAFHKAAEKDSRRDHSMRDVVQGNVARSRGISVLQVLVAASSTRTAALLDAFFSI